VRAGSRRGAGMNPVSKLLGDLRYYCRNHLFGKCDNVIRVGIYCEVCSKEMKQVSTPRNS
jgi:hypothetical protein